MSTFKSKKITVFLSIVFIGYIVYILSVALFSDHKVRVKETKFTIGTISDVNYGSRVSPWFDFSYQVEGVEYSGIWRMNTKFVQMSHDQHKDYIGLKYKVKYVVEEPNIGRLQIKDPIRK